jgi:DNA repair protein RadD
MIEVTLRDYQQRVLDDLDNWFRISKLKHPCLVLPTGSGKSHIIAAFCKAAIQSWPDTKILMLTHVKELIEQNAARMREHWPDAPMGIYSSGMGLRQLGNPITFAGIQSVRKRGREIGHIDLIIIDECHLVGHSTEGGYRTLIDVLTAINPNLRVVGLTATPYRLGHGVITDKPAIFDELLQSIDIPELVHKEFLAKLRSKKTEAELDTSSVHKRGGEFIESELQAAVNTADQNQRVVDEVIKLAGDRRSWLFFCSGIKHSENVAVELNRRGIVTETVTGDTPKLERTRILTEFRSGIIKAVTNANVLTTGFDHPDLDLIVLLRPTMSVGLYIQMAGRGMRPKSHTDHCLVLDFAGNIHRHGPITNVEPPKKGGDGDGEAPVKVCDNCQEIVHISVMICPACGTPFPVKAKPKLKLGNDDIMGLDGIDMEVESWKWSPHVSQQSGKHMLLVRYYGHKLSDKIVSEYFCINHEGFVGTKAVSELFMMMRKSNVSPIDINILHDMGNSSIFLNTLKAPKNIKYKLDGKFFRVTQRSWENENRA